jgi:hypothetical protein
VVGVGVHVAGVWERVMGGHCSSIVSRVEGMGGWGGHLRATRRKGIMVAGW